MWSTSSAVHDSLAITFKMFLVDGGKAKLFVFKTLFLLILLDRLKWDIILGVALVAEERARLLSR